MGKKGRSLVKGGKRGLALLPGAPPSGNWVQAGATLCTGSGRRPRAQTLLSRSLNRCLLIGQHKPGQEQVSWHEESPRPGV